MSVDLGPKAALIVVDIQNDFADPRGSLYVRDGEAVIPVVNEQVNAARTAGAFVVYTQDWHPASTPHFQKDGGIWPVHCVKETWGAEFHPDLEVVGESLKKGTDGEDGYSAFSVRDPRSGETTPTRLEAMLRERGVRVVTVCGLATDYCVVETVLDAQRLDFSTDVLSEAIRAVDLHAGDGDRALELMREAGAVVG
ncbi:MAG TPA: isochorismatase family protein [Actinomycetota bacterium]|nr:isochorismatase family protein [Actinomycetota bacterium]